MMHGAEFLLGLVLIGLEHMRELLAVGVIAGVGAWLCLRPAKAERRRRA